MAKDKKPIYKRVWFWIIIVIVILVIAAAASGGSSDDSSTATDDAAVTSTSDTTTEDTSEDTSSDDSADSSDEEASEDYAIEDVSMDGDEYSTTVSGTFTNQTDNELSYVSISVNFYDEDGTQIDTAYANTTNLAAGKSWSFEAVGFEAVDEIADYEITDVTYY